jgi:glutaredoxin
MVLTMGTSSAEIYKWVDEDGVVHYSDAPTQNIFDLPEQEEISSTETVPQVNSQPAPEGQNITLDPDFFNFLDETQEDVVTVNTPTVEIYETSWCGYCEKAKNFFRSRGIDFVVYDIEKDQQAARRMMTMTDMRAVPFVVINGQGIQGYSEQAYALALQN